MKLDFVFPLNNDFKRLDDTNKPLTQIKNKLKHIE
jgi:hypothetical protein